MGRENYYILLELPFDPPATDPAEIKAVIDKKRQKWTSLKDNPEDSVDAIRYLEILPDIEKVMLDPALREEEARAAVSESFDSKRSAQAASVEIQVACPACASNIRRDSAVCAHCAAPISGECPDCGARFEAGPSVCVICGFRLAEMVKALDYISEVENALIDSNWSSARRALQYANKFWPGHTKLATLEEHVKKLEERYAYYVNTIADCVRHRQYYAAQELIEEAKGRRIRLSSTTVRHVEKTISDVEQRIALLQGKPAKEITFESIQALAGMVSDSMEIDRMLSDYPPESSPRLIAHAQGSQVRLSWEKSPSVGIVNYVVVRKRLSTPLTAFDGEVVYEGISNSFIDKNPPALTEIYYCVYSKRGSTYSKTGAVTAKPVLIAPEVENLKILPKSGGAQLSWDFSPDIREVMVWRKLGGEAPTKPGDGVQLDCERLDGFIDDKLRNDAEYWYFVVAVYVVNGKKIGSPGVSARVTPRPIVAPIEYLSVTAADVRDEYVANWEESFHDDVLLLVSERQIDMRVGSMETVDELLTRYRRVDIRFRGKNSARFHYNFSGGVYVIPVVTAGRFGTIGMPHYITNVRDVVNLRTVTDGSGINLIFDWPVGEFAGVAVAWRIGEAPKSIGEPGGNAVFQTRQQCELDGGIKITGSEPGIYYFRVYSVFMSPDGERRYSEGSEVVVDNRPQIEIFYEFKYTKPLFRAGYIVTLTIRADEEFMLPRAVVVGKVGRLPLKRTDGIPLFELDKETRVRGAVSFEYKTSLLPQNMYIRLFLYDDSLYERVRLLPVSEMKVT